MSKPMDLGPRSSLVVVLGLGLDTVLGVCPGHLVDFGPG